MVTPCGSEPAKWLTQVVRYLSHGLTDEVFAEAEAEGEPVTEAQFEVLRYIDRHTWPTIGEVAGALGISSAAATKMAKALGELRSTPLVERRAGVDRREVHLRTTPVGEELVQRVRERYTDRIQEVLDRMARPDREALETGLRAFLAASLADPEDCDAACLRCGVDGSDDCVVRLAELAMIGPATPRRC